MKDTERYWEVLWNIFRIVFFLFLFEYQTYIMNLIVFLICRKIVPIDWVHVFTCIFMHFPTQFQCSSLIFHSKCTTDSNSILPPYSSKNFHWTLITQTKTRFVLRTKQLNAADTDHIRFEMIRFKYTFC